MPRSELQYVEYEEARKWLRDGDILLHRSTAWYAPVLRAFGRSEFVHASMVAWWHGRVHLLQAAPWGDPKPLLSPWVYRAPGSIDVYRHRQFLHPATLDEIVERMIEVVGRGYAWSELLRVGMYHLPIVRLLVQADTDDRIGRTAKAFCSHSISYCYSRAGIDLVPNLADRATEPGDLGRSALLEYQYTLGAPA